MGTTWTDVSQHQRIAVDASYPHPVFCFRTNSGDKIDTLAIENAVRAQDLIKAGQIKAVIAYYFFWPGQANCDLHKSILEQAGLWGDPRLVTMVDVEGAPLNGVKRIRGDQSPEVNDEVDRLRRWYGDPRRVIGYWNPIADPELWPSRLDGMRLVVPSYGRPPGQPAQKPRGYFAHQYTDRGQCAPWPEGVDLNFSDLELPELLASWGIDQGGRPVGDIVTEAAAQLHPWPNKIRQIQHPEHVNESTKSPAEPWTYDMWADVWNETVWDGFELPESTDDEPKSLVGWILDTAARVRRIEAKLDRLLEGGVK
jgi:hypothetical protein